MFEKQRGLYTVGVLDAMMENDINLRTTVGISAGGLSGVGYVSGQVGWGVRIDLSYRHDWNYCGLRAFFKEKGITGFNYLYKQILLDNPLDKKRLNDPSRRFIVGATNMLTGQTDFFEKGKCSLSRAVQASATVPYLSRPVVINGTPYMDVSRFDGNMEKLGNLYWLGYKDMQDCVGKLKACLNN